jgi:L-seryl-tRNA(Ser) seleniumtransferase
MDQDKINITAEELRQQLRDGHPSIETVGGKDSVGITAWMMQPGQERIVARRIKEILESV